MATRIGTYPDRIAAEIAVSVLRAVGIRAVVSSSDDTLGVFGQRDGGFHAVVVPDEDAEKARQILKERRSDK